MMITIVLFGCSNKENITNYALTQSDTFSFAADSTTSNTALGLDVFENHLFILTSNANEILKINLNPDSSIELCSEGLKCNKTATYGDEA